ncbi:dienelactone hydrolase [Microthyrium microscopicum]|uniref:Dienelactone hydrolase n=1 Tax=Microthyrium microscopicum TaxID=703497 RepID=A0A6A6TX71_9PEZI|nr:dienelactone hydrolase [Microthyrium microscopicum]
MSKPSESCCTTAPAVVENYKPRGYYVTVDGTNTYITGPAAATRGILMVFDIFGFCSQTLQGADILAYSSKENPYLVIVPDFFDGTPAQAAWFAPDASPTDQAKIGPFFQERAVPSLSLSRLPGILSEVTETKGVKSWGALGLCWGGKVIMLSSGTEEGLGWKAAAQVHPSLLDPEDAKTIKIPFAMLPSGEEDQSEVEKFGANLTGEKVLETFHDMNHGWMGARANLQDQKSRREFERGYGIISEFFVQYL